MINIAEILQEVIKSYIGDDINEFKYYNTFPVEKDEFNTLNDRLAISVYEMSSSELSRTRKHFLELQQDNSFIKKEEIAVYYFDTYSIDIFSTNEKAIHYKEDIGASFFSTKGQEILIANNITIGNISKPMPAFENLGNGQKLKRYSFQYNLNYFTIKSKDISDILDVQEFLSDNLFTS